MGHPSMNFKFILILFPVTHTHTHTHAQALAGEIIKGTALDNVGAVPTGRGAQWGPP